MLVKIWVGNLNFNVISNHFAFLNCIKLRDLSRMLRNLEDISFHFSIINRSIKNCNLLNTEVKELKPCQTQVCFSVEMLYNDLTNESIFSIDTM